MVSLNIVKTSKDQPIFQDIFKFMYYYAYIFVNFFKNLLLIFNILR